MGRISGASHVNLRSGPGVSHPSVTILKNGATVQVDGREGTWYHVSVPQDGSGYIYEEFLDFTNGNGEPATAAVQPPIEVSTQPPSEEPPPASTQVATTREIEPPPVTAPLPPPDTPTEPVPPVSPEIQTETTPPPPVEAASTQAKPPSRVRTFQNRLWLITRWVVVPLCIFALGWICGGNYYLRRDRIQRTKIRF